MRSTLFKAIASVVAVAALQLASGAPIAVGAAGGTVRLRDRSVSVGASLLSMSATPGTSREDVRITVTDTGLRPLSLARTDFDLSSDGDMFGARAWTPGQAQVTVAPGRSRIVQLSFDVPSGAARHAALFYRLAGSTAFGHVPLSVTPVPPGASSLTSQPPTMGTFSVAPGSGDPWGTAIDGSGNIWFAEPGCDFSPSCPASTPAGQIGEFDSASGTVTYYALPNLPGNQPMFLAFDGSGDLWFTTPDNSMIGEFSPASQTFVGQWPVTSGSGPWDLSIANGQIWYTEHLVGAIGRFDPTTHAYQDFPTPSAGSNPYGIVSSGSDVWFTENNSSVDRIGVLDTTDDVISEYPILASPTNSTPHLIALDSSGHPWWTEGWSGTIATLDPAVATPGTCGTASGPCRGIERFQLPASNACGGATHVSGIAVQASSGLVWLDDSLTAQVGSFSPATRGFALSTLSNCNAHPHDGLNVDGGGDVWYDDEFANALGELVPAGALNPRTPISIGVTPNPPSGGSPATFTASFTGSAGVPPARWSFGDGTSASGNPVTHTYSSPGPRTLTAVITQASGAADQLSESISVAPAPTAPVNRVPPAITGTAQQGQTLLATTGGWSGSPTSYTYQWEDCSSSSGGCVSTPGATGSTYTLTAADVGSAVRVQVTAANVAGPGLPATSSPTAAIVANPSVSVAPPAVPPLTLLPPPAPLDLVPPTISGNAREGWTLRARIGSWSGTPTAYSYQWQRCGAKCENVTGATRISYTVVAADIGERLRVVVTASNTRGAVSAPSPLLRPAGPSAARVSAALRKVLALLATRRAVAALLGRGRCVLRFNAPSGGVLTLRWSTMPPRARDRGIRARRRAQPMAVVSVRIAARGPATTVLRLSAPARRWLAHLARPRVKVVAEFSAVGGPALTGGEWLVLRGGVT